jgi:hypothetical protein
MRRRRSGRVGRSGAGLVEVVGVRKYSRAMEVTSGEEIREDGMKERRKRMKVGMGEKMTGVTVTRRRITGRLLDNVLEGMRVPA